MTSDEDQDGDVGGLTFSGDAARSLLIVDDDAPFRTRLARAMEKRGFSVVRSEEQLSAAMPPAVC